MSKKINWTRNTEVQLIQELRERPILWDISHSQYNRSDLKAIYWEKVAEALGSQITIQWGENVF
ncbi:hypothetical protein ALC57_01157 [Trachymyrmex cornetzi]|uniref:MADF domain-containing protein n=1 Tax=Trachymyrmex cornetzi TaxID=471704 RepID=A0A151JQP5_9HYME|nr:hypothetical protein ALC57_01157 [Trachymyrmex cornetzi]